MAISNKAVVVVVSGAKAGTVKHEHGWQVVRAMELEHKAARKAASAERKLAEAEGRSPRPVYVPAAPTRAEARAAYAPAWRAARDAAGALLKAAGFRVSDGQPRRR